MVLANQDRYSINKASMARGSMQKRHKRLNCAIVYADLRQPTSTPKPRAEGSNPSTPAMFNGRNRSDREKKRKAEISRDFSAFFDSNFFRISIDPFPIFFRVEGFELPKTVEMFTKL